MIDILNWLSWTATYSATLNFLRKRKKSLAARQKYSSYSSHYNLLPLLSATSFVLTASVGEADMGAHWNAEA